MSLTVDHESIDAATLGLRTVGQVLAHLKGRDRLVVHLLVDGREPPSGEFEQLRGQDLSGRTVYIETAEPRRIAAEVFDAAERLLSDAEQLRTAAVDHLAAGQHAEALKKLGACFTDWNTIRESVEKVARLLRIDLGRVRVAEGLSLRDWLGAFAGQLADIRAALEHRDYVHLADVLTYEAHGTADHWRAAIGEIRRVIA